MVACNEDEHVEAMGLSTGWEKVGAYIELHFPIHGRLVLTRVIEEENEGINFSSTYTSTDQYLTWVANAVRRMRVVWDRSAILMMSRV